MGFILDDASDYVTVKDNIVYGITGNRSNPVFLKGVYNEFTNNIIVNDSPGAGISSVSMFEEPTEYLKITRNIFYNVIGKELYVWRDWSAPPPVVDMNQRLSEADKNLFFSPFGHTHL
jgi:hypothetical protein